MRRKAHLCLDLPKKFLLPNLVQPQSLADTSTEPSLESHQRCRDIICLGLEDGYKHRAVNNYRQSTNLMDELQISAVASERVSADITT